MSRRGDLDAAVAALKRLQAERADRRARVALFVDWGPRRRPVWRVVADGVVVAASSPELVGRTA